MTDSVADLPNPLAPIESILLGIPGAATPLGRVAIFGGAGAAFAYFVRPSVSFLPDGRARNWIFTHPDDPQATLFPSWAYVLVPGLVFGVLI